MTPTPSLVSDCASSASLSTVARPASLFHAWMYRAKVLVSNIAPVDVIDHFDKLYKLEEVPSILVQGPLPTSFLHDEPEFQSRVQRWASTLCTVEEDEFGILPALPTLAFAYSRIRKASNIFYKEHAPSQRRGIHDIIELAFSARRDRHCEFRTEESYRLVASAGNPDAESDTLVTIPSGKISNKIRLARLSAHDPSVSKHLYWSTAGPIGGFSIIGFAGEFKKDDNDSNKNQVIMTLASAQLQRKALELKDSIIMGAISSWGRVQIFSSYWESANSVSFVCIYAHEQLFDLSDPAQLIHLYVFFSKLEKDFQGTLASELATWNTPTETAIRGHQWRSPDHSRKRRRTDAGEGGRTGNRGGEGGNGGLVDADGFDGDQCMDIIKWRDEVAEGGKEGRVVVDGDNVLDAP